MSKENVTRRISIYVNGKEVENSLKGVDGQIVHVKNSLRKLVEGTEDYDKKKSELTQTLTQLTERQKEYRDELGLTTQAQKEGSVGLSEFKENLSKIFVGLSSGDLSTAKEGFNEINGSIKGMVKSALAFIATPLGAAIAVLSTIAIGTKAIFDFNNEAEKSAVLIENLSGKTGKVVEDIRIKIQSMTDTFGLSFEQLAAAVDNLVDTGVAKDELEALDKIKNGLLTAPDKNEFISGLESTAVIAKQIGLDLEDVIALKKQIETTGVNPEATFGALEKATQRLQLGADGLRSKMSNALGAAFTDDVLAKVTTGQISITKALDLINTKSKEVGLNQTQQAELGKELFGKGAIAAGGYATVLDTVAQSIKNQKEPLNENQKALDELEKANTKLGKAQSELFRVKDFGSIWTGIKASATDALSSILEWIVDVKKDIQPLIDLVGIVFVGAWKLLKNSFVTVFDAINLFFKIITFNGEGVVRVLKGYFSRFGIDIESVFSKLQNKVVNSLKLIFEKVAPFLDAIGIDVDKIQKKLDSFKSKEVKLKTSSESDKPTDNPEKANTKATQEELEKQKALRDAAHQKEIESQQQKLAKKKEAQEKHNKEIADMAIALAKSQTDLAKAELDNFIANNRSKVDGTKKLTPELIAEETKRLDDIKFLQENALAEKRLNDIAKAEQDAKSAEELVNLKKAIDLEYHTAEQNLEFQFLETTTALKTQYEEEQKQLKIEQLQAQNELDLLEIEDKYSREALVRKQAYDKEIKDLDDKLKKEKITKEQYDKFVIALDKKNKEQERLAKIQSAADTLNELGKLASATTAIFGQNKASATATALINGGLAVTEILKTPSTFPEPFASISRGIQIAAAAVTTAKAISSINSAKAPATPKFFYGGSTGNSPVLGNDEYGPVTGVVHSDEWVAPKIMTQSPKYAATFSWLENERKAILGNKFFSGGETSPGTIPTFTQTTTDNENSILLALNKLNDHLDKGIKAETNIGYKQAREIQKLNDETANSESYGTVNK